MKTDAELVALLLTEARAKRARYAADPGFREPQTYAAHLRATMALDAAVLGRLEVERGQA